ncbi:hypothetical protein J437_LFUL016089 [Ladona fulva]|uniref:Retrovirus-related Pol polyprotein from transposon TNT 1-94-like beta-barrel domain-containing protein n=1 Tax=Ladona fulva TaxID=123851 RepID=A0A8K0KP74_LADFU|nr:hypothetical protein J437_LFUL016089 [Ladona fulva]
MEIYLDEKEVLEYIENPLSSLLRPHEECGKDNATTKKRKEDAILKIKRDNKKCKSLIVQRLQDDQLELIKDKPTAYDVWKALEGRFEKRTTANRMTLSRKLNLLKYRPNEETLNEFCLKFDRLARELKQAGDKTDDEGFIMQFLWTLPQEYEGVVSALQTLATDNLTMEFVKIRLEEFEPKIHKLNCPVRPVASGIGAPAHKLAFRLNKIIKTATNFIPTYGIKNSVDLGRVNFGKGSSAVEGKGTVSVRLSDKNGGCVLRMKNVLFVPDLKFNLVSVGKLTENDVNVSFMTDRAEGIKNDMLVFTADQRSELFVLESADVMPADRNERMAMTTELESEDDDVMEAIALKSVSNITWHCRLGHLHGRAINKIPVLENKRVGSVEDCSVCIQGKFSKLSVRKSSERISEKPLDLVHSDLMSVSPISNGGSFIPHEFH